MDISPETYTDTLLTAPTTGAPHDISVEQSLLGALLWNADRFHDVAEIVESEAFYAPKHRTIFSAMTAISSRGEAIDSVTVAAYLADNNQLESIGDREYLCRDSGDVPFHRQS